MDFITKEKTIVDIGWSLKGRERGVNYFNDDLSATSNNVSVELRGSEEITKKAFYSVKERWMERQAKEGISDEKVSFHNIPFCYFMCCVSFQAFISIAQNRAAV